MATVYYDKDTSLQALKGRKVAILGYGSQGHAHAQNLRDSGVDVIVGVRKGRSFTQAESDGFQVYSPAEASELADVIMLLLPDEKQPEVYHAAVEAHLTPGKALLFAHGFNIHFNQIEPPAGVDVLMVAPKGPGHLVRRVYVEGGGVPSLIAVEQDATGKAHDVALAYAKGIGSTRAAVIETSFKEETETDLFGEQAVLCGGVTSLIKAGFETLLEAGYQPEIAYFECMHEMKLIVDLLYEGGLANMRYSISDTAQWGDFTAGPRVVTSETKKAMKQLLTEIQTGVFAKGWILENQANRPVFNAINRKENEHPLEVVGRKLREMMPFINQGRKPQAKEVQSYASH